MASLSLSHANSRTRSAGFYFADATVREAGVIEERLGKTWLVNWYSGFRVVQVNRVLVYYAVV